MFLGGMFVGVAMVTRLQLLLIPVCAAMIVSSLSVILQVMYCNMSAASACSRCRRCIIISSCAA